MPNILQIEAAGADGLYDRYSRPEELTWESVSDDLFGFYDADRLPEDELERELGMLAWLADELAEVTQADFGSAQGNDLHSVGELSYLSGSMDVRLLATSVEGLRSGSILRADAVDYTAQELGTSRDVLAERLKGRAFKILHEMGDFNWFVNAQIWQRDIDPLEAMGSCELASPATRSWIGKLAVSDLTLAEFSDLATHIALSSRLPREHGSMPLDRIPSLGLAVVEDKVKEVQIALERGSSANDEVVDLTGCSLVYMHSVLESRFNTPYSEMVYFNLMKLLARRRQKSIFGHAPDSLETSDLLDQWQPWLAKHERTLPRAA